MRRFPVLVSVVAVMLLGMLALHAQPVAIAQEEATPSADEMAGETIEPLGFAVGVPLPSPADMFVARFSLEPGVGFPLEASDPTGGMVVVESGAFTVRIEEMAWTVNRGEALRAAMAGAGEEADFSAAMEEVAMGEEAVLETGDVAWVPGSVSGEIRNDGQEPAEAIVFLVGPAGSMSEATPTP
jgi:quercetin dioxygenase-like cupin family protein